MAVLDRLHMWLLRDGGGDGSSGGYGLAAVRRTAAAAAAGVAAVAMPGLRTDTACASVRSSSSVELSGTDVTADALAATAASSDLRPNSSGGPFAQTCSAAGPAPMLSSPAAHSRLPLPPAPVSPQMQPPPAQAFPPVQRNRGISSGFHRLSHSSFALPSLPAGTTAVAPAATTPGLAPSAAASGGVRGSGTSGSAVDGIGHSSSTDDDGAEGLLRCRQPSPIGARFRGQDGPAVRMSLDRGASSVSRMGSSGTRMPARGGGANGGGGDSSPLRTASSPSTGVAQLALKASRLRQRVYELTSPTPQQQRQPQHPQWHPQQSWPDQ